MSNIVHGRATIKLNGRVLASNSGATLDLGGYTKTTVTTDQGPVGFSRTPRPAKIVCKVPLTDKDKLEDWDVDDGTATFTADSGQQYLLSPCWTTGEPVLANDGYDVVIEAKQAKKI